MESESPEQEGYQLRRALQHLPVKHQALFQDFFHNRHPIQRTPILKEREIWIKKGFWDVPVNSQFLNQQIQQRVNMVEVSQCRIESKDKSEPKIEEWRRIIKMLKDRRIIKRLKFENCDVNDHVVQEICVQLPDLIELDLRANQITDFGALIIASRMHNLKVLYLRKNQICDQGARVIANNMKNMRRLYIGGNTIGDEGAIALTILHQLEVLYLWGNLLTKYGSIAVVCRLTNLKELWLNENPISPIEKLQIAELYGSSSWLDI